MELTKEVWRELRRPFPEGAVKWKAQTTNKDKTRALAVAFVDARNVMERLDRAVGPGGWHDAYEVISIDAGGYVVQCSLTVLGVTKADVGDSSASGGGGNLAKTAYSDALKRAAVKFGVGRYLYALPLRWVAYDAQHKRLAEVPELPAWARPAHLGEEEAQDPGEALPDAEPEEIPLKPRKEEPTAVPTATKNPGEYVLQFGRKHAGRTLAAIVVGDDDHAPDASYLDWILEKSHAAQPVKMAIKVFLTWAEQKRQADAGIDLDQPQPGEDNGPHWSEDDKVRRQFWAAVNKMHVPASEAHVILVGDSDGHLADYPGTAGDALTLLREYAVQEGRITR